MDNNTFSPLPAQMSSDLADDVALSRVPEQYRNSITQYAQQNNVPIHMAASVMKMESGGNPTATSSAGAMGLMQLMPGTFKSLGGTGDPYDPQQNMGLGVKYLGQLLKQFGGDEQKALAAYNWGPGNVAKKGLASLPPETQGYLSKYNSLTGLSSDPSMSMPQHGNLAQMQVNTNVPDRDSSVGSYNPYSQNNTQFAQVQADFPNQIEVDSNLAKTLHVKDIFGNRNA